MRKLIIMRGVAGSGKSTYAESVPGAIVVSRDRLRLALFGSDNQDYYKAPDLKGREDFITKVEQQAIRDGLRSGRTVISDNTNIEPKYMKPFMAIARAEGAEVEVKVVDVSLHTALSRNKLRAQMGGRNVPEDVIRKQHARFRQTKDQTVTLDDLPKPYYGTPGKPMAFMFDLDGTTFHMNGKRSPYAHNVEVDDPDEVVLDIVVRLIESGLIGIGMSGREEVTRDATESALAGYGVEHTELFMRADNDNRKDSIIKAELFDAHVRDNYDVQFVLDDRNQVVDMWRAMGIKCLQVAEGDF